MTPAEDDLSGSCQKELGDFFQRVGLLETRQCFDTELVVLSRQHYANLPAEIEKLCHRLLTLVTRTTAHISPSDTTTTEPVAIKGEETAETEKDVDTDTAKRKREDDKEEEADEGAHKSKRQDREQVQIRASKAEVDQRLETFVQAKKERIDASNRAEFLNRPDPTSTDVTCARADAREINRNMQMKFDIVNNEDGPLARSRKEVVQKKPSEEDQDTMHRERVRNLEEHLNVQFEPPTAFTLIDRIRILEDRLMDLERDLPAWAAAHFNQPHQIPQPKTVIQRPRDDYVVVPPPSKANPGSIQAALARSNSSLTRAVLEQFRKQQQQGKEQD
ncbi:hypothetical protein BCR43DRAFT_495759 [Syncephalastrum racemosum]|uniref:Uncharacterized protein n=1 Tax=Syncephalastrum racemosum TaxID=13706 RepID=A0A1X2H6C8_SYNRA|nr:hypothetical protein BCR43DRAFT_495759 [Syncephalastrum racemosum]